MIVPRLALPEFVPVRLVVNWPVAVAASDAVFVTVIFVVFVPPARLLIVTVDKGVIFSVESLPPTVPWAVKLTPVVSMVYGDSPFALMGVDAVILYVAKVVDELLSSGSAGNNVVLPPEALTLPILN